MVGVDASSRGRSGRRVGVLCDEAQATDGGEAMAIDGLFETLRNMAIETLLMVVVFIPCFFFWLTWFGRA